MDCPWCGNPNDHNEQCCKVCGRVLVFDVYCKGCGVCNPKHHRFCDACGWDLQDHTETVIDGIPQVEDEDTGVAVLPNNLGSYEPSHFTSYEVKWPSFLQAKWYVSSPNLELSWHYLREWLFRNRFELLFVLLSTFVAGFLRIYRLGDIPPGLHGDEAQTGLDALRILDNGWIGHYVGSAKGQPAGPLYFTAMVVWLLDASIFAVRLSIALLGILTVPATYLLFRIGFGRWVALIGTVGLIASYWHIHLSRTGFMVVTLALVTTIAATALLLAMMHRRNGYWLIAGGLLGISTYTYSTYPMFLMGVLLTLSIYLLLNHDRIKYELMGVCLFGIGLLAVSLPVVHFALHSSEIYFSHTNQVSLLGDPNFLNSEGFIEKSNYVFARCWDALTIFLRNPRLDGVDGLGGRGALDTATALLAYIGLIVCIVRWRSPPHLLALLSVVAALVAIVIATQQGGEMRRSITAIPWVFGLAGIGVVTLVEFAGQKFGRLVKKGTSIILALIIMLSMVWNIHYYFWQLGQGQHLKWVFAGELVDSFNTALSQNTSGPIYLYSSRWGHSYETIEFLFPNSFVLDRSREHGTFALEKIHNGPVTYLLLGEYVAEIARLNELYPNGKLILDEEIRPRFAVYQVQTSDKNIESVGD